MKEPRRFSHPSSDLDTNMLHPNLTQTERILSIDTFTQKSIRSLILLMHCLPSCARRVVSL